MCNIETGRVGRRYSKSLVGYRRIHKYPTSNPEISPCAKLDISD